MALEGELAALMAASQAGDAAAYRALLRACLPVVSAIARAQGVRGEAVDDVVQDTLMTVHRARASYDPARPIMPWLRAITQRRAIDRLRRAGRRPREVHDELAYEAEVDPGPAPGQGLEARDRAEALARAVAALPEGQRQAVEHLGLRELSLDETAALTGRTKGALKVNLHRALKALRASLTQEKGVMADLARHERLVEALAGGLQPVRPLSAPFVRAAFWLAAVLVLGLVLASRLGMGGFMGRMAVPDLALAALGAVLTAVTAAYAAFATSVPGRPAAWALLPLPAAALWIGASGFGCLRGWIVPGTDLPDMHEMGGCFGFLVGVSAPLSALIVVMLRRACPLRPNLTAALGGLAAASAAAALLMPFHPHDTTALDLSVHAAVVAGVIGLNGLAGGRLLAGRDG